MTVVFRYSLIGGTLDAPELMSSVDAVAVTADRLDDVIRKHFGGSASDSQLPRPHPARGVRIGPMMTCPSASTSAKRWRSRPDKGVR